MPSKQRILLTLAVLVLVLGGLYLFITLSTAKYKQAPEAPVTSYKDGVYTIDGKDVQLLNGTSEVEAAPGSAVKIKTAYVGNEATGDLNGDGKEDIAFIISQNKGGAATMYYLVAAFKTDTLYSGTNAILLGDRIAPDSVSIQGGTILAKYKGRNTWEAPTVNPTIPLTTRVKIVEGQLVVTK
ncbi:MAG: hypothetical protein JWN64_409 [Parcubacteria group bacterium]|nr:hypothetical protein [Parcubacteria group bacterium]